MEFNNPYAADVPYSRPIAEAPPEYKPLPVLDGNEFYDTSFNKSLFAFWFCIIFLALVIIAGFFVFYVRDGKMQSNNNQQVSVDPNFNATMNLNAPTTNNNDISLNPSISIYPNITIIIQKVEVNNATG